MSLNIFCIVTTYTKRAQEIINFNTTVYNPRKLFNLRQTPDLAFEGLLKRHYTKVKFFQGSVMDSDDLCRVRVGFILDWAFDGSICLFRSVHFDK